MNIPDDLTYSKDHEWVRVDGNTVTIGVTDHAQDQLGDIVFVDLPEVGETVAAGETFGVLESVKAVSDCFSPVSGKVVEINDSLTESPETVNEDCYGEGWMIRVQLSNPAELKDLMNQAAYKKFVTEESP